GRHSRVQPGGVTPGCVDPAQARRLVRRELPVVDDVARPGENRFDLRPYPVDGAGYDAEFEVVAGPGTDVVRDGTRACSSRQVRIGRRSRPSPAGAGRSSRARGLAEGVPRFISPALPAL